MGIFFLFKVRPEELGFRRIIGMTGGLALMGGGLAAYRWLKGHPIRDVLNPKALTIGFLLFFTLFLVVVVDIIGSLEKNLYFLQGAGSRIRAVESLVRRSSRLPSSCPTSSSNKALPAVKLQPIVQGLSKPIYVTHARDGSGRLFVVEKAGKILVVHEGVVNPAHFLDIQGRVISEESNPPGNWEQGLLSLVFHPDYVKNGRFFVNYTALEDGHTVVSEFKAVPGSSVGDPNSERIILEIAQPHPTHNGGLLKFGPDGFLYIGMGDGGGPNPHVAQNPESLLGKGLAY